MSDLVLEDPIVTLTQHKARPTVHFHSMLFPEPQALPQEWQEYSTQASCQHYVFIVLSVLASTSKQLTAIQFTHYHFQWIFIHNIYTVSVKKGTNSILSITSSNTDWFSKFFLCHNLLEICNKTVIKFPTTPQMRRYTTLWKTDVTKLVNQRDASHHFVA